MASIATLSVSLVANTSRFAKGLMGATRPVQSFSASVVDAARKAAFFGTALAGAAAAGVGLMVRRQFEAVDAIAKTSDMLGIQTEKLIAYQHAAGLAGVEANQFNMALQRMVRRIAEAAMGTGEAVNALRELGLDAQRLGQLAPEDQLKEIADALASVPNASDRVRLAFKLFDSEGVKLLNLLQDGSAGLASAEEEARKLGLTLSRLDAAKIEAANDSITRLKALFSGVARQLSVEMAPFIDAAVSKFVEMGTRGDGMARVIVDGVERVVLAVSKVIGSIDRWRLKFMELKLAYLEFDWDALTFGLDEAKLQEKLAQLEGLRLAVSRLKRTIDETATIERFFDEIRQGAEESAAAMLHARDSLKGSGLVNVESFGDEFEKLRREAERIKESVATPLEQFNEQMELLKRLRAEDLIDQETFERARRMAEEELSRLTKSAEEAGEQLRETLGVEPQKVGAVEQRFGGATAGQRVMAAEREAVKWQRASYDELRGRIAPTLESIDRNTKGTGSDIVVTF